MNRWSETSQERLQTCDPVLQTVFNEVLHFHDCTIVFGHRNAREQDELFAAGRSQKRGGQSKHNLYPSRAVDVIPYVPHLGAITGNDPKEFKYFYLFAGVVFTVLQQLSYADIIRWGGDWDRDKNLNDQKFYDLYHWELID